MIQQSFRAKFFLSMEECKEWEVAASRDEEIQNILASLARLATRNNSHFTREFRGRALGHMSMDSELPRKSLTRLFRLVAEPVFEIVCMKNGVGCNSEEFYSDNDLKDDLQISFFIALCLH
ncbi:uncharacterized protein LOC126727639 isoform X1 [Quercus robur]|uniref:uncharacterized protein LOC126727639 isoform X1 n=1 Tax=Quercus robur TaxID=38942 RepID=UPI0021621BD2|nr:uncharacterized protein LOC126727639 isoform X1 [Quercus robur]